MLPIWSWILELHVLVGFFHLVAHVCCLSGSLIDLIPHFRDKMLCILNSNWSCEECPCRLFLESEEPQFYIKYLGGHLRFFGFSI